MSSVLLPDAGNVVELCYWAAKHGDGVYDTALPRPVFDELMSRAAQHMGYSTGRGLIKLRAYHYRDLVLEDEDGAQRVIQKRLLSAQELPGAPVLACAFDRQRLPFSAFPCDSPLHDVRTVHRIALRIHARARLVFEHAVNTEGVSSHRVFIDVQLPRGDNRVCGAGELDELKRTVENTVQHVFMGLAPGPRKRLALGSRQGKAGHRAGGIAI